MKRVLRQVMLKLPGINLVVAERDSLREELQRYRKLMQFRPIVSQAVV